MKTMKSIRIWLWLLLCGAVWVSAGAEAAPVLGQPLEVSLSQGWLIQGGIAVTESAEQISQPGFAAQKWWPATVPGTALTSLVNDALYPEPLYGENNRTIPEDLCREDWWYRTVFTVPQSYDGKQVWLNFDGINYAAEIWVNGTRVGTMKGAFSRGRFEISSLVQAGKPAALAVRVSPQPDPGVPHEHTVNQGMGGNGGITALDGPTFLCTIGWDWIPAIRDRDTGIWQKVYLTATGPAVIHDPAVTTDLPLPRLDRADVTVRTTIENTTRQPVQGTLKGSFGNVTFQTPVEVPAEDERDVTFDPAHYPQLHLAQPRLWWPNGYGPQNLYTLHLAFVADGGTVSDAQDVSFGIRKITYSDPSSKNLVLSVNGVKIFAKGGDWGMDEAMKRIPRERLEAQIRMHQLANYTIIRNWVGQSTSEDFYDLCDKYGILLWDEFFQPNPSDGPVPADKATYLANVREKILRFRNHPSIAVWCAQNEGTPPKEIVDALQGIMTELDPGRHFQPDSDAGNGVHSGGPYQWRRPQDFYVYPPNEAFKTELGSVSIPTLESIQGMMPEKDWGAINDDWAEHDLASGAQDGDDYLATLEARYGKVANLADFARKGQMMNYEAFRAMYEGREARLFNPVTGVLTWMSNPAQPSFVWQLYHHDLEPSAALFATRVACEPVHVQLNERDGTLQIVNALPAAVPKARVQVELYNLDGSSPYQGDYVADAAADAVTQLGALARAPGLSPVYFVKLELSDSTGKVLSRNFYWRGAPGHADDLKALNSLPVARLETIVTRRDQDGKCLLYVTLRNPGPGVALMAHLQLHAATSGARVLPVYYSENYLSLAPGEERTVTIEADAATLHGEAPKVLVDGWNIAVSGYSSADASLALNTNAQVDHWPKPGMRVDYGPALEVLRNHCGGGQEGDFRADGGYTRSGTASTQDAIETTVPMAGPEAIYQTARTGEVRYTFPIKSPAKGDSYAVRLHFAEFMHKGPGERQFDVSIDGRRVLTNFDITAAAGAPDTAVVREFTGIVPNEDGNVVIRFTRGAAGEPMISAIEILPAATN
jgi:beta-galactosidase/beta-glucuronidase